MNTIDVKGDRIILPPAVYEITKKYDLSVDNVGRSGALVAFLGDELILKRTDKGKLENAYKMQVFLSAFGLAPEAVLYESDDFDYLISKKAEGKSAIDPENLKYPKRLSGALGEFLRKIHSLPAEKCPVQNLTKQWLDGFFYAAGQTDSVYKHISEYLKIETVTRAKKIVLENRKYLLSDTVLHGDYCLPNVMLVSLHGKHAIDVGEGGVGDRHFDLFWGLWSLSYNLKTDIYKEEFLSAYGKNDVQEELITACGCLCLPDGF